MSKYDNYGTFMIAVLDRANSKSLQKNMRPIIELLGVPHNIQDFYPILIKILEVGWPAFVAVCAILVLGPIAFLAALTAFIVGGIGALIVAALAIYGGIQAIKLLYQYRDSPLKILEVGKKYKDRFDSHIGDYSYIDNLIDMASDDLLN
jgi:hypothetical protein